MATFILINVVTVAGIKMLPGEIVDDAVEDTSKITAAGGSLVATGNATLDAAALRAQNAHKNRGANEDELTEIMQAALDSVQGTTAAVPATRTVSTTAPITGGGDLSANRTFAISAATAVAAGSMSAADKAKLDTDQFGTGTLVAGVSAVIAATITANSRIEITGKDKGASTAIGRLDAPSADRVVGAPGSFIVRSFNPADATAQVNDVSTFDWRVVN